MKQKILITLIGAMVAMTPIVAAAGRQPSVEVCHVAKGNPARAHAIRIAAASLEAHLAHGDSIFGLGLNRDCDGGLRFEIDGDLSPVTPTLPGLEGGAPRPVAVLSGPDGRRDEFVEDELEIKPANPGELDEFLGAYGGEIVRGDVALIINDSGEIEERPGGGWYLLRITPETSTLADLPQLFADAGFDGAFRFSSEAAARTMAALLREGERILTPNLVLEPHAIRDHPLVPGADPSNPASFLDFAQEPYMTEDDDPNTPGDQGLSIGVVRAWEYLRHTGLPPQEGVWEPARIAIIDNGFDVDPATGEGGPDFLFNPPPQVDLVDYDGSADGPAAGNAPWHGQGTFGVCCAYPRNLFGGAGRGGEYVRPIPIKAPLGFADIAGAVRTAWLMNADVINMSVGAQCNWLCDVGDFFVESHLQEEIVTATVHGATVLASAGNGPDNATQDFDVADGDWIPCEMDRVTCVGAVDANGDNMWNWGNGVDIWAPTNTLATLNPNLSDSAVGRSALVNFGGTSAAAPFAAGIAGLLKTAVPTLQWNAVQQILVDTANPSGDFRVSTGYVDALRAVQAVRSNPPPTVRFIFLDNGDTRSWARTGPFQAIASDEPNPRGFVGHVEFRSNIDGLICETEGDTNVPSCIGGLTTLGDHVLTVTATDEFGASAQNSITVEVTNDPPLLTLLSPEDGTTRFSDQAVPLRVQVFDFDGEAYNRPCPVGFEQACLEWTSSIDGDIGPTTSAQSVLNFTRILTPGTHLITVKAIDGKGASAQENATITILEGVGVPTARILTSPRTAGPGETTVLQGVGTDPEDGTIDPASYQWTSSIDGPLGTGSPLSVVLSDGGCESIRNHTITLTVTDSNGNTDTDMILIQVILVC